MVVQVAIKRSMHEKMGELVGKEFYINNSREYTESHDVIQLKTDTYIGLEAVAHLEDIEIPMYQGYPDVSDIVNFLIELAQWEEDNAKTK